MFKLVILQNFIVSTFFIFSRNKYTHNIVARRQKKALSNKLLLPSEKEYRRSSHRDPFSSQDLFPPLTPIFLSLTLETVLP